MPKNMYVRRDRVGKILLLKCERTGMKGAIALGRQECDFERWHIAIKTDNFQHPSCIDFTLTNGRSYERGNADSNKYSVTYTVGGKDGTFHVYLRWTDGHSPYPQIKNMEVWCFGVYLGNRSYPKANDAYADIATVVISKNGAVTVNSRNAGIWPEFI